MFRTTTHIVCALSALSLASTGAFAQTLLNGSLEGPPTTSSAPPDWFNWQITPDTCDSAGPFNNTGLPWTPSPDGGTFARGIGGAFANSEAIGQVVPGFSPGTVYTVNFFQTNLGFNVPSAGVWLGNEGFWDLAIDGVVVGSSSIISKPVLPDDPIVWGFEGIDFTATAPSHLISLVARSDLTVGMTSFMGIDGVRISPVPTPGSMGLLAMGGLAAARRRRA